MPTIVDIPNVGKVEFPDTMTVEDINSAIHSEIIPKSKEDNNAPTPIGSFSREAARSALPTGSAILAGMGTGAAVGLAGGPLAPVTVPVSALIAGTAAAYGTRKLQDKVSDAVAPDSFMGTKSAQKDAETNPISSTLGGLVVGGRPSAKNLSNVARLASAEGRQLASQGIRGLATGAAPKEAAQMAESLLDVGVNSGMNAGMTAAQGGSASEVARDAGLGAIFSKPWVNANPASRINETKLPSEATIPAEADGGRIQASEGLPSLQGERDTGNSGLAPQRAGEEILRNKLDGSDVNNSGDMARNAEVRGGMRELPPENTQGDNKVEVFQETDKPDLTQLRGSQVVRQEAHNLPTEGSIPSPATTPDTPVKPQQEIKRIIPERKFYTGKIEEEIASLKEAGSSKSGDKKLATLEALKKNLLNGMKPAMTAAKRRYGMTDGTPYETKPRPVLGIKESRDYFMQDPLVEFIMSQGGLRSKSVKKTDKTLRREGGEYDSSARLAKVGDNRIYNPNGMDADKMAQAAYEKDLIRDGHANTLFEELNARSQKARKASVDRNSEESRMAEMERADKKRTREIGHEISVSDLSISDTISLPMQSGGGKMVVLDISPEGDVLVQMPNKSVQRLKNDDKIFVSGVPDGWVGSVEQSGDDPF